MSVGDMNVTDVDVVSSLSDGPAVEYIETAVKPEHTVVSIDKKSLEIPTGMLASVTGNTHQYVGILQLYCLYTFYTCGRALCFVELVSR